MQRPNQLDKQSIRDYYNNVFEIWPSNDKWHSYTYLTIKRYIQNFKKLYYVQGAEKLDVLNAGSGGNDYDLGDEQIHIDIAFDRIKHFKNSIEGSIEHIPLPNNSIDVCLCVGSVINYCDAVSGRIKTSQVGAV